MAGFFMGGGPATPSGVGQALTQPQTPTGQADQEEMGRWARFMQRLKDDPNLRMSMMTMGAELLKTPEFGQSGFDTFSNAAMSGIGTLDTLRQRERAQRLEADDRQFTRSTTTRQLEQGDEQIAQGAERNALSREQLEESKRQFDARLAAGDFGPSGGTGTAGSTGPERQVAAAREAFLASGIFPDDEQGRAMAELAAQRLIATDLITPQGRMKAALELAPGIALMNNMSEQDAFNSALEFVNIAADRLNQDELTPPPKDDELVGLEINHPTQGVGVVESVGGGRYKVRFEGGSSASVSAETIRQMYENYNSPSTGQ